MVFRTSMSESLSDQVRTRRVLELLGARAAGLWIRDADQLIQRAFVPSPELDNDVAESFAEATRVVSLAASGLGIVQAALTGHVVQSIAAELPSGSGSGWWLRAFGATRSVAVPIGENDRGSLEILSVALPSLEPEASLVAQIIRRVGGR
jgi:hypothetical protein